jgi:hypothetical protein
MAPSFVEKPAPAETGNGLQIDRSGGLINHENIPINAGAQVRWLTAHFRVTPHTAVVIAGLAFGEVRP